MDDQDKRTERPSVPLSPRELALVDQARGTMPRGQYMRMWILEGIAADLGLDPDELDTARRPAQRRRNYTERK
jgi:hypothetical protein